ncbi:MAG TPA: hypothetical protein PLU67_07290 [Candidatus Kapabacteria bacterium]|nr:hypothetical protein [Candidatus Kapabacteria bacterium]HPP38697.1 hypothetical protein [Candidatus Kapabacteria bacterium]
MKKTFGMDLTTENLDFLIKLAKENWRSVSAQLSVLLNDVLEKERKKVKDHDVQKEQQIKGVRDVFN